MTLHIDTTDAKKVEIALKKDEVIVASLAENQSFGSQVLLPMIEKLLKQEKLEFKDLTNIEVNTGPGSFTGIRVGAAAANALGYTLNIPVNGKKLETDLVY